MIHGNHQLQAADLLPAIERMWELSAGKIRRIEEAASPEKGAPVFTVGGRYTARGWTEWTQGFQYGSAILQFDATGDEEFLEIGRSNTLARMAPHLTHQGVHDHGFNNVSTYGGLWRLMREGRIPADERERELYELALRCSGAVQARRWTTTAEGGGFVYSFNGPHSLFADTVRSMRSLALAHLLGHPLLEEHDERISLLGRLVEHCRTTSRYNVYFGEDRDAYDVWGRVAHESIFNPHDGRYRSPATQQGYSPFTTWTRALAWIMLGFAEEGEFLGRVSDEELEPFGGRSEIEGFVRRTARAACDHYLENTPSDGIPYWDTGAPGLVEMEGWRERPADPDNDHEPVDSSAAAIAAQGFLRLGRMLRSEGEEADGRRYEQAGLALLTTLLAEPYLAVDRSHQGLIRHSIYHRPGGWDHVPEGSRIPRGESSMWGDYHIREAALQVQRIARDEPYLSFCGPR
jgi:unsaturated chondroitin disaccharide hydrolase